MNGQQACHSNYRQINMPSSQLNIFIKRFAMTEMKMKEVKLSNQAYIVPSSFVNEEASFVIFSSGSGTFN